jgi:hypothetical protein
VRVWLDGLDWEQGGEYFIVGSEVEWDLWPFPGEWPGLEPLGKEILRTITHYTFPDDGRTPTSERQRAVRTRGRVESISAAYFRWVPTHRRRRSPQPALGSTVLTINTWLGPRHYRPVIGSAALEAREEPFPEPKGDPFRKLEGFIVELSPVD